MEKTTTLLLASTCALTFISNSLCMDVEFNNNSSKQRNTSQQGDTTNTRSKKNNQTDKLLETNNILLYTLIMQNKIHFEYQDNIRFTTDVTINRHANDTKKALDNLYVSSNTQLNDKSLHIPMTHSTIK